MTAPINVIIADDHQMVIDGIKSMLLHDTTYQIIAEANNGQAAYELITVHAQNFQLLITDISMPLLTGPQLCKMIKSQYPHIQVLILSMYNNVPAVKEAVMAEADGYILKNAGRTELLQALHRISNGGTYFFKIIPRCFKRI